MNAHVTSRVSLFRGTTRNEHDDEQDDNTTPVSTGLFVSLIETTLTSRTSGSFEDRTVRRFDGRAPWNTDIRKNDRLLDEITGDIMKVTVVTKPRSPVHAADVVFEAKQELL
jgi:hypothetical protein